MIMCDWCGLKISDDAVCIGRDVKETDIFSDTVLHFHSDCWELAFDVLVFGLEESAPVHVGILGWTKKDDKE